MNTTIDNIIDGHEITDSRKETLTMAADAGASIEQLEILRDAMRVRRKGDTIILPRHHYESCSRGRGWARKGKGSNAEWGERVDGGYRVGPGRWVVGGHDGFRRKDADTWEVSHITIGDHIWTIAS